MPSTLELSTISSLMADLPSTPNPYATRQLDGAQPEGSAVNPEPPTFAATLLRWTIICVVSAAPSFLMGFQMSNQVLAIPAMLVGIGIFAVGYSYSVRTAWARQIMEVERLGAYIKFAFSLRILASVIFPLGLWNDMFFGFASVSTISFLASWAQGTTSSLFEIFCTTLLQGTLLSLELYFFAVVFCGFSYLYDTATER